MKVILVPGQRDEALISKVKVLCDNHDDSNAIYDLIDEYGVDAVYDALYYACENRDAMLADQTLYFQGCLYYDEQKYYIDRMIGLDDFYPEDEYQP